MTVISVLLKMKINVIENNMRQIYKNIPSLCKLKHKNINDLFLLFFTIKKTKIEQFERQFAVIFNNTL